MGGVADRGKWVQGAGVELEWSEVGRWPSLAAADEHALVVLAMRMDCRVEPREEGFALEVELPRVDEVRSELEAYAQEQAEQVAPRAAREVSGAGWVPALLWAAALIFLHFQRAGSKEWVDRWANDGEAVWVGQEFWRAFTALFLHADGGHLAGNVLIGGAFCVMVGAVLGGWRGWLWILVSGSSGNLLAGWLQWRWFGEEEFRSIGASTATFGALGLLVGVGLMRAWRDRSYGRLKRLLVPLGVGTALISMYGAGGVNTDVVGHFSGFGCGMVLGLAVVACEDPAPVISGSHESGPAVSADPPSGSGNRGDGVV
ncbi:MAG: rhomboid family intramembrane serine protease [Akkermansiaceae bacterium]|nr:rhomboid family intramembrane serine protease [Akkermansiaceae bacterium]